MKRNLKPTLRQLVVVCIASLTLVSTLGSLPAAAATNTCPPGQEAVTSGSCCLTNDIQITSTGEASCVSSPAPCSKNSALDCLLTNYIDPLIALLSSAVGVVVVITIIRGALEYTSAGGDPAKVAAGKQHIISAIVGLFAYLVLFAFLQFIVPGGII